MKNYKSDLKMQKGLTLVELLVASSIAILVIGGMLTLWLMTQDTWTNERIKSEILQKLQLATERIKKEIQKSDGGRIFFHAAGSIYDGISLPIALDDGRNSTGYSAAEDGDGFVELDTSAINPLTGAPQIYWDQTIIYFVYENTSTERDELRRVVFYPRDNSLTAAQRQDQIDKTISLGAGNGSSIPNYTNCQNSPDGYRTLFTAGSIALQVTPRLREFDGYSETTERTESLISFGSDILEGGYHTIKLKVTNKNTDSSGYAFGIDSLKFTPPGSVREGENYLGLTHPDSSPGIVDSSADAATSVNMYESAYGIWSADHYLNYAAGQIDDYLTLQFYYDRWYETTFSGGTLDNVVVEFSNINGKGETEGEEEYIVRLEGNGETWDPLAQTQNETAESLVLKTGSGDDTTYRNHMFSDYTSFNGMKVSVKFRAGTSDSLTVQSAYMIQRSDDGEASPDDSSSNMPNIPITFNSCHLDPRNQDQVDSLGQPISPPTTTTGDDVKIPAEGYAWSNWVQLYDNDGNNFNFNKTKDYFISFYVPAIPSIPLDEKRSIFYWEDTSISPETHSYARAGQHDGVAAWGGTGDEKVSIYSVEEVAVTYVDKGSFSSQVFDTGIDAPAYGTMSWNSIVNSPDATLKMRIRASGDESALESDPDWTSIPGYSTMSTPASLAGIGTGRYVQYRADFDAGDEDYDLTCVLKDVSIYWPGETSLVDVGGYFTKRPDYGIFTVEIDGQRLTKGFIINLSIEETLTTGTTVTRSLSTEVEPRNTNK